MVEKISGWKYFLANIEEVGGAFFMAIIAILSFMNVITRYLLNYSTAWTEEFVTYIFVWATLLGSALAYRQGTNLAVTFIYGRAKGRVLKCLYLTSVLASVFFFSTLGYYGFIQVRDEFSYKTLMESVPIPMAFFSLAIPLGAAFIIFRILMKAAQDLRTNRLGGKEDGIHE